ncbi:hypothetical protein [Piscibacillus salipiscarius]|uniref:hypothetical protein n=1 Tax=Piscibacillus salipiscarius TaxID=299480 RepID=UPI0024368FCE|nr:hypothetical protein [Piscibacillus salipiscarius]
MSVKQETKQSNKFQWIFMVIMVPIIFAIIIGFIISSVAGVDVMDKAKELGNQLPFISADTEKQEERELEHYESTLKDRDQKIADLESQIKRVIKKFSN